MPDADTDARRGAIHLLDQVLGEKRLLSECLSDGALKALPPGDRARAQRLAAETLRGLERADRLLHRYLRKHPSLSVHNALRLGTIELCQGVAAHGVVNAMVQIVGGYRRHAHLKGLVNAVLRKIAAEGVAVWPGLPVPRLRKWLRAPLLRAWGGNAVAAMERAHFAGAALDLTVRPGRATSLPGAVELPTGSLRLAAPGQVSALPGYQGGDWWVQDAAAALPAKILAPRPAERVLDMCAAPGGKAMQLAAVGAEVVALDISERRIKRVRENLGRTGLSADLRVGDALAHHDRYGAILLDAPCSATGTIRRHPDLPYVRNGSEIPRLIALQAQMLAHAWRLLRPGGRMVFCTCSLLPDEGEARIAAALTAHPDMRTDPAALRLPGVDPGWVTKEGGLRLRPDFWPDLGGMDGFYIACLRKAP